MSATATSVDTKQKVEGDARDGFAGFDGGYGEAGTSIILPRKPITGIKSGKCNGENGSGNGTKSGKNDSITKSDDIKDLPLVMRTSSGVLSQYWDSTFVIGMDVEVYIPEYMKFTIGRVIHVVTQPGRFPVVQYMTDHWAANVDLNVDENWSKIRISTPSDKKQWFVGMRVIYSDPSESSSLAATIVKNNKQKGLTLSVDALTDFITIPWQHIHLVASMFPMNWLAHPINLSSTGPTQTATTDSKQVSKFMEYPHPDMVAPKRNSNSNSQPQPPPGIPDWTRPLSKDMVKMAMENYVPNTKILVYWVDKREWQNAIVLLSWQDDARYWVHIKHTIENSKYFSEEDLDISDKFHFFRLCLAPKTYPMTLQDEKKILSTIWPSTMYPQASETWFVIPRSWWREWILDVEKHKNQPNAPSSCMYIDNSQLSVKTAIRSRHYELVPSVVWQHLLEWYGGGPAIPYVLDKSDDKLSIWTIDEDNGRARLVTTIYAHVHSGILTIFQNEPRVASFVKELSDDSLRHAWIYTKNAMFVQETSTSPSSSNCPSYQQTDTKETLSSASMTAATATATTTATATVTTTTTSDTKTHDGEQLLPPMTEETYQKSISLPRTVLAFPLGNQKDWTSIPSVDFPKSFYDLGLRSVPLHILIT